MLNHCAGDSDYASTGVLQQHLFDCKLRHVDVAPQVCSGKVFEILCLIVRKRLRDKDARVVNDTIYGAKAGYCRRSDLVGDGRIAYITPSPGEPIRSSEGRRGDVQ